MSDYDPLDGADIGDIETVTVTRELWVGDLEADACRGSDRLADSTVVDTEIVTDEHGDEHLAVTVESDVTKRLPYRWDEAREPRTDRERTVERRGVWKRRIASVVPIIVVLGLSFGIAMRIMNELAGDIVINGEPMAAPSLGPVAVMVVLALLIAVGLPYMPRGLGGRSR